MKKIEVKVCACTQCVMNGAMDIVESVEALQKLKIQLRLNSAVKIISDECLCEKGCDSDCSPRVCINGEIIDKASSEAVTEKIISIVRG